MERFPNMAEREVALTHLQCVPGGYEGPPPRTGAPMSRFVLDPGGFRQEGRVWGCLPGQRSEVPSSKEVDLGVSPS